MTLTESLQQLSVDARDLAKAQAYQERAGGRIEKILVGMGVLVPAQLPDLYASLGLGERFSGPWPEDQWQVPALPPPLEAAFFLDRGWVPLECQDDVIRFVADDPMNLELLDVCAQHGMTPQLLLAGQDEVAELASRARSEVAGAAGTSDALSGVEEERLRELAQEAPTVNLLNQLLHQAVASGASDLHLEPADSDAAHFRVRLRVDGVMHEARRLPAVAALPLVTRLKLLAQMNIAEHRRPQDGKFATRVAGNGFDLRVSALPLVHGESVVIRFLAQDSITVDVATLGFADDVAELIEADLTATSGVILLTGPTGSGKTTSLYAFLQRLNQPGVKIVTLEDPVEYELAGINQVQVSGALDYTFASGLRSIVRQDPDIIMLGEIRDGETASVAMQSSLTGHLVFSTVHTNDAPSAYTRLLDLGVQEYLLNAALNAIIAQRLVRRLCPHCAVPDHDAESRARAMGGFELAEQHGIDKPRLLRAVGCEHCAHIGYRGRFAIIEHLRCDDFVRNAPKSGDFLERLRAHNRSLGKRTLREDGLLRVMRGESSLAEVLRVTG